MYPTSIQFAKITNNYLNTNSSSIVSPAIWVTGNKSKGGYKKSPLLDERTAAVLVAMGLLFSFLPFYSHTLQLALDLWGKRLTTP